MADTGLPGGIYLKNMSGEEVEYAMPQGLTVTTVDGSTKDFINEDLIDKLPEVTEADNGKVFGVVNGKWQAMEAPTGSGGSDLPEVTDSDNGKFLGVSGGAWKATNVPAPSSYPASQVTGLAPVATSGVYESLYYAPVGPKYVIPPHDVKFERNDKGMWRYSTVAEYAPSVGTECEVEWNKETFLKTVRDCSEVASLAEEGYAFIGNAYIFTGEDTDNTGEEFLFVILHQQWPLAICYTNYRNALNVSIDFRITVPGQVKKLDKQYLPDGIATEQFVKNAVASVGGTSVTERVILEETELSDFVYFDTYKCYVCNTGPNFETLVLGEKYAVVWDGVRYVCTAQSVEAGGESGLLLGDASSLGGTGNGEPFVIGQSQYGTAYFAYDDNNHTVSISYLESYKVSWDNVMDRPFGEETSSDIFLPETELTFSYDGGYTYGSITNEETAERWGQANWTRARVTWDGETIELDRGTYMGAFTYVGNPIALGGDDNGLPFTFVCFPAGAIGDKPVIMVMAIYDTPEEGVDPPPDIQHTIGVTIYPVTIKKIEDRYQHQADWSENDERKAGFILNRPFGKILNGGEVLADHSSHYDVGEGGFWLYIGESLQDAKPLIDIRKITVGARYTIQVGDDTYTGIGCTREEALTVNSDVRETGSVFVRVVDGENTAGLLQCSGVLFDVLWFNDAYVGRYVGNGSTFSGQSYRITITTADDFVQTIDRKFLPSPPEFDLTAMGLPDIPMDGTLVSVNCDTSELLSALSKGPVWYSANYVSNGMVAKASGLSSQAFTNGSFQISTINYLNGSAFLSVIAFADGVIDAFCKPLAIS